LAFSPNPTSARTLDHVRKARTCFPFENYNIRKNFDTCESKCKASAEHLHKVLVKLLQKFTEFEAEPQGLKFYNKLGGKK